MDLLFPYLPFIFEKPQAIGSGIQDFIMYNGCHNLEHQEKLNNKVATT